MLYHGTLVRHLPSIESEGLIPTVGEFTKNVYGSTATGVLPAVFMADEKGLERVVHALVAAVMDEITDEDYEQYDIGPHFHMNDALFYKYVALAEIEPTEMFLKAGCAPVGMVEPEQAEDGDWYSLAPVHPVRFITGDKLRSFFEVRGLVPSSVNDFVDPEVNILNPAPSL